MGAVLSFFRPAPVARGDWSQQELAEFYRVEAALTQSGLRVTSDRGVSDENDPWFVFCRFDGEVILHFARIDGQYVVASEAFEHALRGPDFRTLLNAVAAEHPTLVPLPRPDANGRRGNLVMHPAALLAAIVASVAFQLAGGDAVAGELASDAPTVPMLNAADSAGANSLPGISADAGMDRDDGPRADRGEEDRYAQKQVLVLSVMALISTTLPTDDASGPVDHLLAETQSMRFRDQTASVPAAEKAAAIEEGRARAQANDSSAAELSAAPTTSGPMTATQPGQLQARLVQSPSGMTGFDYGTVDDHEHLEFHLLNNTAPVGTGHQPHVMLRMLSLATSAEKAVPTGGDTQASAALRDKPADPHAERATEASGAETSSASRKIAADVPSGTEIGGTGINAHAALGIGNQANAAAGTPGTTSQALSVQAPSTNTASAAEKAGGAAATWTNSASTQTTNSVSNASSTSSATIRTAINSFIDQQLTNGDSSSSSSLTAVDLTSKIKVLDLSVASSAKALGSKLSSDILGSLTDSAAVASKTGSSASTTDQSAAKVDISKAAAASALTASSVDAVGLASVASGKAKAMAATTLDTSALGRSPAATDTKALDKIGTQLLADVIGTKTPAVSPVGTLATAGGGFDSASPGLKGMHLSTSGAETDLKIGIVGTAPDIHHGL